MHSIMVPQTPDETGPLQFTWYHREELQVAVVLVALVLFFSRSTILTVLLLSAIIVAISGLYLARVGSRVFHRLERLRSLLLQYHEFKLTLGRESLHRSRVAMAIIAAAVITTLAFHRLSLAQLDPHYATPTDVYWMLFLAWYAIVCTVIAAYLLWIWGRVWDAPQIQSPILDGLVASLFFYHGLSRNHRIVTFVAGFLLGGVPSYFGIRLQDHDPLGYQKAVGLIIPVVALTLGGAFYAMRCIQTTDGPPVSH